jgi:hypothetical protein
VERDDGRQLVELTVRACEHCGGPIPGRRKDARFCSTSHRVMASRTRRRDRETHQSLVTRGLTDQSLAELHAQARPPRHWRDQDADDDKDEFSDEYDVGRLDEGTHDVFSEALRVQQAVEDVKAQYDARIQPLLAQQARNGGVRLLALVRLELERDAQVRELLHAHQKVQALEWAERDRPARVATAHERQLEAAASTAFARDLGRGRFLRDDSEPAGRPGADAFIW